MAGITNANNQLKPQARPDMPARWSKSETRFVVLVILGVLFVTSLPFAYAYLSTPPDKQFMGIMLDVPDHAQYFSWMRELTTQNLAANMMTPEANRPLFFNLLWWGMARLGSVFGVGYAFMFQVLRIVATILFLLLTYRVCAWFFDDHLKRKTAFVLVTFTSGFGWVLIVIKYLTGNELMFPLDVFIAEGNTLLGILGYPHFIAAALYIFIFDLVLRGQRKGQLRYAVWAGLAALFLGWQHAYDLVSIYAVLLAYAVLLWLRDKKLPIYMIWSGLIIGFISVWPALYSVLLTSLDPVWKDVLKQFANAGVYTPNLLHLPILFGFTFLLAIYSVIRINPFRLKLMDNNRLFILGWFLVTFLLIYLPVDYQIHLLNGWQVPMAILATIGLYDFVLPRIKGFLARSAWREKFSADSLRLIAAAGLILAVVPTNLYLFSWRFLDLSRHDYPYYLYKDELQAMEWLDENAQPDDVIISSLTVGQYIPAMTGSHAYLAHWAQTLDFFTKTETVNTFFGVQSDQAAQAAILLDEEIDYVFYGPAEKALGIENMPGLDTLSEVYSSGLVTVYKVNR